ncbi:hypothetical protein A2777_03785 [Candidatus Gottesmanbacteria bacterium RIFCSPHIGHO2_01_FULL_40_15]|uniref:Uncharacterized protein n=1 Tax=Candidatus Gottesmanbacteria bacterium RIFCSPHIGHO2_01_FULL_40_15 TaxID=1798376 RepID=A0A1F5Z0F8_9BACT|nr:MAG: hypothetical protein A2777_03785 [Candidatus Gottesmanbacteria bacterium RIFCSPHIGHO2_01_FULL_40_15]
MCYVSPLKTFYIFSIPFFLPLFFLQKITSLYKIILSLLIISHYKPIKLLYLRFNFLTFLRRRCPASIPRFNPRVTCLTAKVFPATSLNAPKSINLIVTYIF